MHCRHLTALDKCWVQNHSELFRLSEPFHDKAIEICKIEARLEACEPADPSRATLQASLDTLALQQKESKLANLDQLSTQYMCKPESVCWLYRPPRSFHALDLADVSAAKGASTVTAVESDSGTGSDAE